MRSVEVLFVAACAGCTYQGSAEAVDARADAAATVDARDAGAIPASCAVEVPAGGTPVGQVGGSQGGTARSPLECPALEAMVGVALLVSDGIAGGPQERSAQGIRIGCAAVVAGEAPSTGAVSTVEAQGDGGAGWAPSQWTAMTTCPPGRVIAGMLVHSGQYDAAFIDASIECVELDGGGAVVDSQAVYVAGSLTEPLNPRGASCNAGDVLASATPRTGAGLDSLQLACVTPRCAE